MQYQYTLFSCAQPLTLPLHVLVGTSHGFPVSMQWGPFVFGDTSPSLLCAKAATNFPCARNGNESHCQKST